MGFATVADEAERRKFFAQIEARLISVQQAADISGFETSHIRKLLAKGKLDGVKLGRDWWTTADAVEAYLSTERRPGPKTD